MAKEHPQSSRWLMPLVSPPNLYFHRGEPFDRLRAGSKERSPAPIDRQIMDKRNAIEKSSQIVQLVRDCYVRTYGRF
jgi:hypothetical protein